MTSLRIITIVSIIIAFYILAVVSLGTKQVNVMTKYHSGTTQAIAIQLLNR